MLNSIEETEELTRLSSDVNHLRWLAGHITNTRFNAVKNMGVDIDGYPYKDLYQLPDVPPPANRAIDPNIEYPTLSDTKNHWNRVSGVLAAALSQIPEAAVTSELPIQTPMGNTLGELVGFLSFHEAYHIGQMGLIRKNLGHEAMSFA